MNRTTSIMAVLACSSIAFCIMASAAELPEATAVPSQAPVKLDGVLDDACWRAAKALTDFHVLGEEGKTTQTTSFRVAYDNVWLYLAFTCSHPTPDRIETRVSKHDGSVHTDESVEVFIDPGSDGNPYFHFKLSCAGVKAEQRATKDGGREPRWQSPWLSAVRMHEKGWDAEIAIPLYVLASYGDLSKARINVTRNTIMPYIDAQGVKVSEKRQLSSWSPMIRSFHEPNRFGALKGLHVKGLAVPFLASFENPRIGGYRMEGGTYCYDVFFDVRCHNARSGKVLLTVIDEPVAGKGEEISREVEVKGTQRAEVTIAVPVAAPVQRTATIIMKDVQSGATFQRTRITEASVLDMMSVYLGRTFYTTEENAKAVCALGLPPADMAGMRIVVADGQGNVLGETKRLGRRTEVPFRIAGLPAGKHRIAVQWKQANGEIMFSQDLVLRKLAPKPGLEWKVDKINKVLLRDGKPFFSFGLVMAGINSDDEADLKKLADAGFNTAMHWSLVGNLDEADGYVKAAKKYGLFVLARPEGFAQRGVPEDVLKEFFAGEDLERVFRSCRPAGVTGLKGRLVSQPDLRALPRAAKNKIFEAYYNKNLERMLESVKRCMNFPNVIGFNSFDEPCLSVFDQDVQGRDLYQKINEIDGYHPGFLLYSSYITEGENATNWCDALGTDPYWIPAGMPGRNSPNFVSKIVWMTKKRADSVQKATWIVPMGEYWSGVHKRAILPLEQYCQTYLALIHGAKMLFYFRYPINHQMCWDALANTAQQLKVLGPIAVTPDIEQEIKYCPGKFDPDNEEYPDVQVSLRRNPSGGLVLLAANSRPHTVAVSYRLSCLDDGGAGQLFGKELCTIAKGSFSDRLAPYGTRAYTFARTPDLREPVQIEVASTPVGETPPPEIEVPRSGRPGKRNIAPNPSFEEASLPGWPDYYRPWYSDPLIGNENSGWGQDPNDPFHGQYCLRVTRNQEAYNGLMFYCSPQHDRPTQYVFSIYLKAERDGMKVTLGGGGCESRTVTLTTSWQRYHTTGTIPPRADRHNMLQVRLTEDGVVWADAVQFEIGDEPTAFEN